MPAQVGAERPPAGGAAAWDPDAVGQAGAAEDVAAHGGHHSGTCSFYPCHAFQAYRAAKHGLDWRRGRGGGGGAGQVHNLAAQIRNIGRTLISTQINLTKVISRSVNYSYKQL